MKPFLQGKRNLELAALRTPFSTAAQAAAAGSPAEPALAAGSTPQIDIVKQGDKIVRIVVTCTCGERTEIECLYSPGQS